MAFGDVFAGWQQAAKQHYDNLLALDYQNKQSIASTYAKLAEDDKNYSPEQRTEFARRALKIHTLEPGKKLPKEWENMTIQVQPPTAPKQEQLGELQPGTPGAPVGMAAPEIAPPTPPAYAPRNIMQPLSPTEQVEMQRPMAEEKARLAGVQAGEVAKAQLPEKLRIMEAQRAAARIKQETDLAKIDRRPVWDENGNYAGSEAIPENELAATKRSVIDKNRAVVDLSKAHEDLYKAQADWNESRADPNSPDNLRKMALLDLAKRRAAVAEAQMGLHNAEYMAKYWGKDAQGNDLPNVIRNPETGEAVGTAFQRFYGPTMAALNRASGGRNVISQATSMMQFAADPHNAEIFGKEGGLRAWLSGKIGTNDPRLSGIAAQIESLASFLTVMHGARGAALADGFKQTLRNIDSPEAFSEAVNQYLLAAERLTEEAKPNSGIQAPGTPTPPPKLPGTLPKTPGGRTPATPPSTPAAKGEIRVQGPGGTLVYGADGKFIRVE